ncbi:hypothetical protein PUNSTDRAFT_110022 [Punctularia strigosozonata HHB-11173 SS5]|uniref:uncharacterized protein n=1 Tax=Punctularia strigosozonata (strain HHB-11173) TaxID=741275 RepID=UPI00044168FA|nr:uncharacterized protein PUNSTDRAFT_110022 [Punctularia strigosozonata HHB-11173 SS5]EIN13854.1 hypothetical protein PUNSTDRAFT_110022 [Punctularia strigosozonata HHB-11173 SS5]
MNVAGPSRPTSPGSKAKTPIPPPPAQSDAPANTSPGGNRPLNVTDALGYLDAVKNEFQDRPDVYNRFLDIMKDFKSQNIDTPGVIERVSRLFQGNALLIQGFNTFLPHGYRIDCSSDPNEPNTITVTTPMGIMTQNGNTYSLLPRALASTPLPLVAPLAIAAPSGVVTPGGLSLPSTGALPTQALPTPGPGGPPFSTGPGSGLGHPLPPIGSGPGSRSITPHPIPPHIAQLQVQPPGFSPHNLGPFSPGIPGGTSAAASFLGGLNGNAGAKGGAAGSGGAQEKASSQGEFNHAISYLNKIKTRFSDDPNTYKQFLEILQTYQKEQKHLQDSQVYAQVQMLFKDAPDLLEEFKNFLPTENGASGAGGLVGILPHPPGGSIVGPASGWTGDAPVQANEKASTSARAPAKRRKRAAEKEPTPVPPARQANNRSKKAKLAHRAEADSPNYSPFQTHPSPQMANAQLPGAPGMQHMPSGHLLVHSSAGYGMTTPDELMFFDRAKKALDTREAYEEFLKLLGLFSKDIIDARTLVERAEVFLGDGDLLVEFKELMAYEDAKTRAEHGPPGSIRTREPEPLVAQPPDDDLGPSYRRLPESEIYLACSARDELARSVLNDVWVSHPTWQSEEQGFMTHKKNSFEELIHRCEEERHEFSVHLQAMQRTIAVLEPLASRIETMTAEERASFRLQPDLGGSGRCLYERTIKRVYTRETAEEILQALQDAPAVAVPVVLRRLRQKDEEWRRVQREWNRNWREVDHKNFYKSIDHQGINSKQVDKKSITAKAFVIEIETVKTAREEDSRRFGGRDASPHLTYDLSDMSVLHDTLKLGYSFLDHSHAAYTLAERRHIARFLRDFVTLLAMQPPHSFDDPHNQLDGANGDTADYYDHGNDRRTSFGESHAGPSTGTSRHGSPRASKQSPSKGKGRASPEPDIEEEPDEQWINEAAPPEDDPGFHPHVHCRPFFANTTFYALVRIIHMLYSRLLLCKRIGDELAAHKHRDLLANPVATELGLDDPSGPPAVFYQMMRDQGASEDQNVVYPYLLEAIEKVFEHELDQPTFEEHMRWFFGGKGYQLFTVDKMIMAMIKQVQTIIGDNKCQELWSLLQTARENPKVTASDVIRYRREAELHLGSDDHLYRIEWARESNVMSISLLSPGDPSVGEDDTPLGRWRQYVDSFVMVRHPTEWVGSGQGDKIRRQSLFLRR